MGNYSVMIIYLVVIVAMFYFMAIRPQRKEAKQKEEMLASMAIGDYCVTSSGFYGQIIDITSDMVILEFGNKNCRIPMVKSAIASIEKAGATVNGLSDADKVSEKINK